MGSSGGWITYERLIMGIDALVLSQRPETLYSLASSPIQGCSEAEADLGEDQPIPGTW